MLLKTLLLATAVSAGIYEKRYSNVTTSDVTSDSVSLTTTQTTTLYLTLGLTSSFSSVFETASVSSLGGGNKMVVGGSSDSSADSTLDLGACVPTTVTVTQFASGSYSLHTTESESTAFVTEVVTATIPITATLTVTNSDGSSVGEYVTTHDYTQTSTATHTLTVTHTNTIHKSAITSAPATTTYSGFNNGTTVLARRIVAERAFLPYY